MAWQTTLAAFNRRCSAFRYGEQSPEALEAARAFLRGPVSELLPEAVPVTEWENAECISRVLREKALAGGDRVLTLSTTALITSGAKSQFETFLQKTDDLSTSGILV